MWTTETVCMSKGKSLIVSVQGFCDICNFKEPEDVVNIAGYWRVEFQLSKLNGVALTRSRRFKSKTYADQFTTLLRAANSPVISTPRFHKEILSGFPEGLKMVTPDGKVSVKEYMDIMGAGL